MVQRLIQQKQDYWVKTLSESAIDAMLDRVFSLHDYAAFWSDWVLSDTLFSTLLSLFYLDIPLSDVVPWLLNWSIELPSLEEFLSGVLIELEPVDLLTDFPWLSSIEDTLSNILESWVFIPLMAEPGFYGKTYYGASLLLEKAYYGEAHYDSSFYDPEKMREFLRSTIYAIMKKALSPEAAKIAFRNLAETHGISPVVVEDLWNRMTMVTETKLHAPVWDYGWWDVSYWPEETEDGKPVLPFTGWDGSEYKVETVHMGDTLTGGYWDLSFWDMSYWTQDENPFRVVTAEGETQIQLLVDRVVELWRRRWITTPLAVANYQTAEERQSYVKSERVETYGLPVSHSIQIENAVEGVLGGLNVSVDAVRKRMYKTAALELYSAISTPHKWGLEGVRVLSREELKDYWVRKWSEYGLDSSALSTLFDRLYIIASTLGRERVNYRLRSLQYRLARR